MSYTTKFYKILNNGVLERIEKGKEVPEGAIEISKNEYYNLSVGLQIFVCGLDSEEVITAIWRND